MIKNRWLNGASFIDKLTCFVDPDPGAGGDQGGAPAGGGTTLLGSAEPVAGGDQQQQQQQQNNGQGDGGEKKPEGQQQQQQQEPAKPEIGKDPNKTPEQNAADVATEQAQLLEQAKGYELKLPDGYQADPELRGKFDPIVAKHRLSKDAAQDLVNFEAEIRNDTVKKHWDTVAQWGKDIEKDPEIGGANLDQSKVHISTAVRQFGDPEFVKLMNDTGYGNNPALARVFARIGKAMGEGTVIPSGGAPANKKSAEDVFYGGGS